MFLPYVQESTMRDDGSILSIIPRGKILIIAEIGTSHGGDLNKAKRLIDAAVDAGANCVKFQVVFADEIVHPLTGFVDLPGGRIPLYERFKSLERGEEFYRELKDYTEKKGVLFLASSFGLRSTKILKRIGIKAIKIASPELNHFPMLEEIAGYGVWKVVSSGVSKLGDIERAFEILGYDKSVLLHCVTSYPAPEEEYNLRIISNLSSILGLPVGVSDHSLDPILVPVLSVLVGGVAVEKHFTLSNEENGLDDRIALIPEKFETMVKMLRSAVEEPEIVWKELEYRYGKEKLERILGDGVKRLAKSERESYLTTNRSIHALREIEEGEVLSEENISILRTEKNLKPGLDPSFYRIILGKRVVRRVRAGEGLEWDDLLLR